MKGREERGNDFYPPSQQPTRYSKCIPVHSRRDIILYFDRIVFQGELENDDLEYSRRRRLLYSPEDKNDSKLMIITRRICISPLLPEIKFSTFSTRQHGLRRSRSIDFEAKFP